MAPLTPMRRLLRKFELIRPVLSLGKRHREASCPSSPEIAGVLATTSATSSFINGSTDSSSQESMNGTDLGPSAGVLPLESPAKPMQRARIAIQQDDPPFDALVITTLPCYPFCCHEDLIMMSRAQLVEVVDLFNAHLPRIMQIEVSEAVSDAHIRHCIETLVGIVPNTPPAPKAIRLHPNARECSKMPDGSDDAHLDVLPSPSVSPLAMRVSRRAGLGLSNLPTTSRLLECLEEEDEEDIFVDQRPWKKRKVSDFKATPILFSPNLQAVSVNLVQAPTLVVSTSVDTVFSLATGLSPAMGMLMSSPVATTPERNIFGELTHLAGKRRASGQTDGASRRVADIGIGMDLS